jgi:hypothetical protein
MRAPFARVPLSPGPHVVRVSMGEAADVKTRLVLADGVDAVLVPVGPTLSLHTLRDALDVRDRHGEVVFRRALEARVAPGGVGVVAATLLAWLFAAFAMGGVFSPQASLEPPGALSALGCAAISLLGPMLLLRAEFLFSSAVRTGAVLAVAGAAMVLGATWRALPFDGVARWLVFAATAPAGLGCIALGLGGADQALVAMVVVGLGVAVLCLRAHRVDPRQLPALDDPEDSALLTVPAALGELVVTMEHGVVGAVAGASSGVAHITAWMVATADEQVFASPADRVAEGLLRTSRAVQPMVGASVARIAWALLALLGAAALLYALWPGG